MSEGPRDVTRVTSGTEKRRVTVIHGLSLGSSSSRLSLRLSWSGLLSLTHPGGAGRETGGYEIRTETDRRDVTREGTRDTTGETK